MTIDHSNPKEIISRRKSSIMNKEFTNPQEETRFWKKPSFLRERPKTHLKQGGVGSKDLLFRHLLFHNDINGNICLLLVYHLKNLADYVKYRNCLIKLLILSKILLCVNLSLASLEKENFHCIFENFEFRSHLFQNFFAGNFTSETS